MISIQLQPLTNYLSTVNKDGSISNLIWVSGNDEVLYLFRVVTQKYYLDRRDSVVWIDLRQKLMNDFFDAVDVWTRIMDERHGWSSGASSFNCYVYNWQSTHMHEHLRIGGFLFFFLDSIRYVFVLMINTMIA